MENHKEGKELTEALEAAADERPGALSVFYQTLLNSTVWVPIFKIPDQSPVPIVGEGSEHGFQTVHYEGRECVLCFSEKEYAEFWAGGEVELRHEPFSKLLWLIHDDFWLYLNANQEVGKEITSWEIAQLRQGPEALPELVAALTEEPYTEYEVRSGADLYPELKKKLLPILEIAKGLEEAFLIAIREEDSQSEKPMLGLRYANADDRVRQYIRDEIREATDSYAGAGQMMIVDDLHLPRSPNHGLFEDVKPFFISAKTKPSRISGALKSFFAGAKGEESE